MLEEDDYDDPGLAAKWALPYPLLFLVGAIAIVLGAWGIALWR
jgi:hypothetical protein